MVFPSGCHHACLCFGLPPSFQKSKSRSCGRKLTVILVLLRPRLDCKLLLLSIRRYGLHRNQELCVKTAHSCRVLLAFGQQVSKGSYSREPKEGCGHKQTPNIGLPWDARHSLAKVLPLAECFQMSGTCCCDFRKKAQSYATVPSPIIDA